MSVVGGSADSEFNRSSAKDAKPHILFAPLSPTASPASEEARLQGNIVAALPALTGFGLLLAFTPCVFPMIPILSGMPARFGDRLTARRDFVLSGTYVLAMALAYAVLGVVVAWSGQNLQAVLQTPAVLVSMSTVFLALAASMFGYYDLQIPQSWQTRLTGRASSRSGSLGSAAIMGFGSALASVRAAARRRAGLCGANWRRPARGIGPVRAGPRNGFAIACIRDVRRGHSAQIRSVAGPCETICSALFSSGSRSGSRRASCKSGSSRSCGPRWPGPSPPILPR